MLRLSPGNYNFWHPPIEVTQFSRPRSVFGACLEGQKDYIDLEAGNSMKQILLDMVQVAIFILMNLF